MKKRHSMVQPAGRPNSDINVTPLVDVVLVLLIIFMVVTPLLEKDIEVKVPETEEVQDVEPTADQLVLLLDKDGNVKLNNDPIPNDQLVDKLKRVLNAKPKEERILFVSADDEAQYGKLVGLMDSAKAAGAWIIGMATEPIPQGAPAVPGTEGAVPAEGAAPAEGTAPTPAQ